MVITHIIDVLESSSDDSDEEKVFFEKCLSLLFFSLFIINTQIHLKNTDY